MINELANKPFHNDTKNYIKNIKIIYPHEISENNKYNLINKDFLMSINNSKDFINSLPELYYLMSNNKKFLLNPKEQKLYKVEFYNSNNFVKLKEQEFNLGYNEIVEKLKELNKIEIIIENHIKSTSLKNISNSDNYYLVNKKWMKEFKTFYNYNNIIKNYDNNINNLFKNQKMPNNLNAEINKNLCSDANIPISFEIVNQTNFDLIIKEINEKNKIQLKFKL